MCGNIDMILFGELRHYLSKLLYRNNEMFILKILNNYFKEHEVFPVNHNNFWEQLIPLIPSNSDGSSEEVI